MQKATKIVSIAWGVVSILTALSFLFIAMIYGIVQLSVSMGPEGEMAFNIMILVFFGLGMGMFIPAIFSFLVASHCNPKKGNKTGKMVLGILAILLGATAPGIMEIVLAEKTEYGQQMAKIN